MICNRTLTSIIASRLRSMLYDAMWREESCLTCGISDGWVKKWCRQREWEWEWNWEIRTPTNVRECKTCDMKIGQKRINVKNAMNERVKWFLCKTNESWTSKVYVKSLQLIKWIEHFNNNAKEKIDWFEKKY